MGEKLRGSLTMIQQRWEQAGLEEQDLVQILEAIDFTGVTPNTIFCKGTPKPDLVVGSVTVDKEVYDRFSNHLLNLENLRIKRWENFPCGIPTVNCVRVDFEVFRG